MGRRHFHPRRLFAVLLGLVAVPLFAAAPANGEASNQHVAFFDAQRGLWDIDGAGSFFYGVGQDQPLLCDWDGDGLDTVGQYRSANGFAYLRNSNTQGFADIEIFFGIREDLPICGDWDGDGDDSVGVYRPSTQRFYLRNTNTTGFADIEFPFGSGLGVPVAGDWDGDGIDTVGLWQPWDGLLVLADGHSSAVGSSRHFGMPGDRILSGDWDGDGRDTVAVYRYDDGKLHLSDLGEAEGAPLEFLIGRRTGVPVAGATGDDLALLPHSGWSLRFVDSEETSGENGVAARAFDGNPSTYWHTEWSGGSLHPHELQLDLGESHVIGGVVYTPRQGDPANGRIADYALYLSDDPEAWGQPIGSGTFADTGADQTIRFPMTSGRYLRLVALSEVNGGPWTAVAELNVLAAGPRGAGGSGGGSADGGGGDPQPTDDPPSVPPGAISVQPGDSIQQSVDGAGPGATFYLRAGVHREQQVSPQTGQTFIGEPGAIMSGAKVLSGWAQDGSHWFVGGQFQQGREHGRCEPGYSRCDNPEDLFLDGQRLVHVENRSQLDTNSWYFDYGADRIYVGRNPTGHLVETSVTQQAFVGDADDVTISGLIIEKYANPAQHGAVDTRRNNSSSGGSNWHITNNEIRWNHGVGVKVTDHATVLDNHIHHNGQLGIAAVGLNALFEGNEVSYNGEIEYEMGWERGGSKFAGSEGVVVRNNHVHHNRGPGLWSDVNAYDSLFEGNDVIGNYRSGIYYEISYKAVIRDNYIEGNGFGHADWLWGAGIVIAGSPDVEIYGNTVVGNADGIAGIEQDRTHDHATRGPHIVVNLHVHDNNITMFEGLTGLAQDIGDNAVFSSRNNRFENNTFTLNGSGNFFEWDNRQMSYDGFRSYGQS